MYRHRYEDISQVGFYLIETEDDFYNTWRDMPENPSTKEIDEVVVVMHGTFYAMMINADAKENLTVSPDGKVGSDPSALRISDLPVRNIETIRLNSCNTGLLNAINIDDRKVMNSNVEAGVKYQIQGNVAQAFLNSQNVHVVYAWDGNMNPRTISGSDRLSHTQGGFHNALEDDLKDEQVVDVKRATWIDRRHEHDFNFRDMPIGLVRYVNEGEQQYCYYKANIPNSCNVIYGRVNLKTSDNEEISVEQ